MNQTKITSNKADPLSEKQSAKLKTLLEAGSKMMNVHGPSSLNLVNLAREIGTTRNALYYYVKDKEDLIRQCYLNSIETTRSNIAETESITCPKKKLTRFIQSTLSRPAEIAIVNEYNILEGENRSEIAHLFGQSIESLAEILRYGQKIGSFNTFDPLVLSHTIFGILDWSILWLHWTTNSEVEHHKKMETTIRIVCDWIFNGVAQVEFRLDQMPNYEHLHFQEFNPFDKTQANAQKRIQLIKIASKLFNQRGIDGVTLTDIGAEMGVTKGAIYNQFSGKTELVRACYYAGIDQYEMFVKVTNSLNGNGLEQSLTIFHLNCQAQMSSTPPLVLQPGMSALSADAVKLTKRISRQVKQYYMIGRGDGSMRSVDPLLSELGAGAFFGIKRWQSNGSASAAKVVADEVTSAFALGIMQR